MREVKQEWSDRLGGVGGVWDETGGIVGRLGRARSVSVCVPSETSLPLAAAFFSTSIIFVSRLLL